MAPYNDPDNIEENPRQRPIIIEEDRGGGKKGGGKGKGDGKGNGGWGWLATLLAVLVIGLILWATGILDINLTGETREETLEGGGTIELSPPNGGVFDDQQQQDQRQERDRQQQDRQERQESGQDSSSQGNIIPQQL